jgi:chemotaxis protein MotB
MARKGHHEDHINHEAWAIPYGDLVTLLLAFFVVMYSISSVNEGKYRVVSESLNAAFRGQPTTPAPIQAGAMAATTVAAPIVQLQEDLRTMAARQIAQEAEAAMSPMIMQGLVDVQQGDGVLEISIRSDILFGSGAARLAPEAEPVIRELGKALSAFPNEVRVEGHTDNVPTSGGAFASNWELSAARAASVVHLMIEAGVAAERLSAVAFGEFRPVLPNTTLDGRNANRRVVVNVVMGAPGKRAAAPDAAATTATATDTAPVPAPPGAVTTGAVP